MDRGCRVQGVRGGGGEPGLGLCPRRVRPGILAAFPEPAAGQAAGAGQDWQYGCPEEFPVADGLYGRPRLGGGVAQAGGIPFKLCRLHAAGAAESVPPPDSASEAEGSKVPVLLFGRLSGLARLLGMAAREVPGGGGGLAGGGVAERGDCGKVAGVGLRGRGVLRLVAGFRGGGCRASLADRGDECPPYLFRAERGGFGGDRIAGLDGKGRDNTAVRWGEPGLFQGERFSEQRGDIAESLVQAAGVHPSGDECGLFRSSGAAARRECLCGLFCGALGFDGGLHYRDDCS